MKRVWKVVCSVLLTLFAVFGLMACGETPEDTGGNSGQQGGGAVPEAVYDQESGVVELKNTSGYTVILILDGKEIAVKGSNISLGAYITHEGEYLFTVKVLSKEETLLEQNFSYYHELKVPEGDKENEDKKERAEISFFGADGGLIKRIVVEKGYTLLASDYPLLPTEAGVTYAWSVESGFSVNGNLEIRTDATYQEYTIAYHLNEGEFIGETPSVYTVEESITLPTPVREGYLFGGWYEKADFSGSSAVAVGGKGNTGNKTLYAKWTEITPEAQELLDALTASMAQKTVTTSYGEYEEAIDLSGNAPYQHSKSSKAVNFVISDGYYYDYEEKYYYAFDRELELLRVLPLEGIYGNLAEILPESAKDGVKSFLVQLKGDSSPEIRIKIKDGLVIYLGTTDGREYYNVSYTVTKITPNASEFERKKQVVVQVIFDGQENGQYTYLVAEDKTLADFPELQEMIQSATDFYAKGFFLDREFTQAVTNTSQVVSTVYFAYYSHQYLIDNTPITLRHTCDCDECGGEATDYTVILKDWQELIREYKGNNQLSKTHEEQLLYGYTTRIFDGYLLHGPLTWQAIDKEGGDKTGEWEQAYPFGYNEATIAFSEAVRKGEHENFVLEIFTQRKTVRTATLTVHIGQEVVTRYILAEDGVSVSDDFLYEYLSEGQVYCGWYADEAMQIPLEGYLGNTELREFYAKFMPDARKEITVHLGVRGGIQFQDLHNAQGQEHLMEEKYHGTSQTVKFFADEELLHALQMMSITYVGDGSMQDKSIAGFYLDAGYTKPVTSKTKAETVTEIYIKWGKEVEYTLHFITGETQTGRATEGTPVMQIVEDWKLKGYTSEYRSVEKFYTDADRTKEIVGVVQGDIFVGYELMPMITLVCEEGCEAETHTARATALYLEWGWFSEGGLLGRHGFYIQGTDEFNECYIYLDAECTQPAFGGEERVYLESDLTVYAKCEKERKETTLHCGCFTHGNNGFTVAFYTETQLHGLIDENCDFGKYLPNKSFFEDEARTQWFDQNQAGSGENGLWLQKLTKVTVQVYGQSAREIYAENLYQALYFYEEKQPEWSDDKEMMPSSPAESTPYGLYEDGGYDSVRILPIEYKLQEGEVFYFKEISYGEFTITVKSAEYGDRETVGWAGELKDCQHQVDKRLFSNEGKMVKAYYYDAELTVLAMQANNSYYLNQSVVLYAELTEMPKATIHYNHYGVTDTEGTVYDLVNDETYETLLFRYFGYGNYPFEVGFVYELCENEDGTGVIELDRIAEGGEYYFVKNAYSKNNIKITLRGVAGDGSNWFDGRQSGFGEFFYLPKGSSYEALLAGLYGARGVWVTLSNGQQFTFDQLINCLFETESYQKSEFLKLYTDEAQTKELAKNVSLAEDTVLYLVMDVTKMKKHTVYLDDKGTFVFYSGVNEGMGAGGLRELVEYLANSHYDYVDQAKSKQYPELFRYGAVVCTYVNEEKTERFEWGYSMENLPEKLYATVQEYFSARVYLEDGRTLVSYSAFAKKSFDQLCPNFMDELRNYNALKPGHVPYLAEDRNGEREVSFSEELNGEYYICYRRDQDKVQIRVGGYDCPCGQGTDIHPNEFFNWTDNGADGEGVWLGTYEEFYLEKGGSLQVFIDGVKEMHAVWIEAEQRVEFPTVKLYKDEARTQEITDLTVLSDLTVFVSVYF